MSCREPKIHRTVHLRNVSYGLGTPQHREACLAAQPDAVFLANARARRMTDAGIERSWTQSDVRREMPRPVHEDRRHKQQYRGPELFRSSFTLGRRKRPGLHEFRNLRTARCCREITLAHTCSPQDAAQSPYFDSENAVINYLRSLVYLQRCQDQRPIN